MDKRSREPRGASTGSFETARSLFEISATLLAVLGGIATAMIYITSISQKADAALDKLAVHDKRLDIEGKDIKTLLDRTSSINGKLDILIDGRRRK